MTSRFSVSAFAVGLCLGACNPSPGAPDTGPMPPAGSCAQPGDVGNENGVGQFCTPTGGECSGNPLAGLCLASLSPSDGQWFCTRLCTSDTMCGTDAVCTGDPRGRACVPARCAPPPEDAGTPDSGAVGDGGGSDSGATDDAGSDTGP